MSHSDSKYRNTWELYQATFGNRAKAICSGSKKKICEKHQAEKVNRQKA